jgi:hypothetical protein
MRFFVRVFGGATFALAVAVLSAHGAGATTIGPGGTLVEYYNTPAMELLNAMHVLIRSVPVNF